jgi:1-acyl-sn-glycerol-3-phosphate acyltransferase
VSYARARAALGPVARRVYRLEVRGAENVPATGALVVAANHASVVDPLVLGAAVPRPLRFLTKEELWRFAPFGRVLDRLGGIPVARGRGDLSAMLLARQALERGEAVAVFPQGAVGANAPWLRGAARLALDTGSRLLPVRLIGTDEAIRRGHMGFPRIAALIGAPIEVEPSRPTIASARVLTRRLESAVASLGS